MSWTPWTEFKPFTDYFEINHYVGYTTRGNRWFTTLEGVYGPLSTAEGLAPVKKGPFDYEPMALSEIPQGVYWIRIEGGANCDHPSGYFDYIGKASSDSARGRSKFQHGIFCRIFDHYRKIVGLPSRGQLQNLIKTGDRDLTRDGCSEVFDQQSFDTYQDLRNFFAERAGERYQREFPEPFRNLHKFFENDLVDLKSIQGFFENKVTFRYATYAGSHSDSQIAKGEGLALRDYKATYGRGEYPFLNSRDEALALRGF